MKKKTTHTAAHRYTTIVYCNYSRKLNILVSVNYCGVYNFLFFVIINFTGENYLKFVISEILSLRNWSESVFSEQTTIWDFNDFNLVRSIKKTVLRHVRTHCTVVQSIPLFYVDLSIIVAPKWNRKFIWDIIKYTNINKPIVITWKTFRSEKNLNVLFMIGITLTEATETVHFFLSFHFSFALKLKNIFK